MPTTVLAGLVIWILAWFKICRALIKAQNTIFDAEIKRIEDEAKAINKRINNG